LLIALFFNTASDEFPTAMKHLEGVSGHCFSLSSGTVCLVPGGLRREGQVPDGVPCMAQPVDQLRPLAALAVFSAVCTSSQDLAAAEPALLLTQH